MSKAWALSSEDHDRISAAVREAEAGTSGEIVTIVADHSDLYHDVSWWWAAVVAVLALGVYAAFPDFYFGIIDTITHGWMTDFSIAEALELALAIVVLKFGVMRILMQWTPLRMFLTPDFIETGRVRRRAVLLFKVGAEARTVGRTGVLIYLSLLERRAEIVADEAIVRACGEEVWGDAMADMLTHVREGRIADGMIAAVRDVGAILAQYVPREMDDANELPDRLIEL